MRFAKPCFTLADVALVAVAVALVGGCKSGDDRTPLLDTGWFEDTGGGLACKDRVVDVSPADGATGVYWRDPIRIGAATAVPERYDAVLTDLDGYRLDDGPVWADGSLTFELVAERGLRPGAEHVVRTRDCDGWQERRFTTSDLGLPLTGGPESLVGKTWHLDIVRARWVEPPGVSALLALYFTTPLLLGVQSASDTQVRVIGAPGFVDIQGQIQQDRSGASWDFPLLPFDQQPYLDVALDSVTFAFNGIEIPVTGFAFQGTFSPDTSTLGGGVLSGLGDTRNAGTLLGQPGNPAALCTLSEGIGVPCQPCPDGEAYCLFIRAENVSGAALPGVVLSVVAP